MSNNYTNLLYPMNLTPLPKHPLVSVLIANYNYGKYIDQAIESVIRQTYDYLEVIICDDGSTDHSMEIVQKYARFDPRIKFVTQNNSGQSVALNNAFSNSRGEIIAILDSDDIWMPQKIETCLKIFRKNPSAGLVHHPMRVIDSDGRILKDIHGRRLSEGWIAPDMIEGHDAILAPASGLLLRREIAKICFPLPTVFRSIADYCLGLRAALITNIGVAPEVLGMYRQHSENVTGSNQITNLYRIEKTIIQTRHILNDISYFAKTIHNIEPEIERLSVRYLARYLLAKDLWFTPRIRHDLIGAIDNSCERVLWRALYTLPYPLRVLLFRIWWGEWKGKRWLRRMFSINSW